MPTKKIVDGQITSPGWKAEREVLSRTMPISAVDVMGPYTTLEVANLERDDVGLTRCGFPLG